MQSGRIKNAAITASSQWDKNHASWLARLGNMRRGRLMSAWSAKKNNYNQWIQVDLHRSMKVTGLATQGRYEAAQWVTAFYVLYSADGVKFAKVKNWWDVVKVSVSLNYRVICVYFCVLEKALELKRIPHKVCKETMDPYVSLGGRLEPLRDQLRKSRGKQSLLCVIAVSSVSQDFGVHNICTKRSSPGKTITEGWFQKLQVILCRKCGTEM